jgi:predicted nucleic acid-binding protein
VTGAVVDTSIALSWCFEDEASAATDALFEQVRDKGALVPGLWHLELANLLLQAETRGRITAADSALRLELFAALPIMIDTETSARAWREIVALARSERLTTHDAAYLELAIRSGAPLMTKDNTLAAAARRVGLTVLP